MIDPIKTDIYLHILAPFGEYFEGPGIETKVP